MRKVFKILECLPYLLFLDHGAPQWSRLRSVLILLSSAVLIAFCADLITNNIEALLTASGVSEVIIDNLFLHTG